MGFEELSAEAAFAANLRAARDARSLTQTQLAELMAGKGFRWHQATVYKVEAGERQIQLGEALALAQILGLNVEQMAAPEDDGLQQRIAVEDTYRRAAAAAHKLAVENALYTVQAARLREALQAVENVEAVFPAEVLAHLRRVSGEDSELIVALAEVRRVSERVWPEDGLDISEAKPGEPFSETVAAAHAAKLRRSTTVLSDTVPTKTATYVERERPISKSSGPQPDTVRRSSRAKA
jgi:transcriptional regulator with XRE-family HTH domain